MIYRGLRVVITRYVAVISKACYCRKFVVLSSVVVWLAIEMVDVVWHYK